MTYALYRETGNWNSADTLDAPVPVIVETEFFGRAQIRIETTFVPKPK